MEAKIRISGSDGNDIDNDIDEVGELAALLERLRGERGLAGAIREVRSPPGAGEPGGAVEVLTLKVTATQGTRSVIEASKVRDADMAPLLREAPEASGGR